MVEKWKKDSWKNRANESEFFGKKVKYMTREEVTLYIGFLLDIITSCDSCPYDLKEQEKILCAD